MRISVYITSYNQKSYLVEAIESVLRQTRRPDQLIIIDDASTDGSQDIISQYVTNYSKLILPIFQEDNQGITACRIKALSYVSGDFVTYLDGDDRYLPNKLECEEKILCQNPRIDLVYSNFRYINSRGEVEGVWNNSNIMPEGNIFTDVYSRNFPRRTVFRNELVRTYVISQFSYDASINLYEDWDFRIRLSKIAKAAYCPQILTEYRIHPQGLSKADMADHIDTINYIIDKNSYLLADLNSSKNERVLDFLEKWKFGLLENRAINEIDKFGRGQIFKREFRRKFQLVHLIRERYCPIRLIIRLILGKKIFKLLMSIIASSRQ